MSIWQQYEETGIYFLMCEGKIVYIGKTTKWPFRLKFHISQKMEFDTVRFIACEKDDLSRYEKRWIEKYSPIHNTTHKKPRKNAIPEFFEYRRNGKQVKRYYMKFRKLTRKSRIGFGSYMDREVQNMIDAGKIIDLIQMYFNLSHITFFDDILEEMKVTGEWVIAKPGTNRDLGFKFLHEYYHDKMVIRKENIIKKRFKESKETLKQIGIKTANKDYHRKFNQGH